MCTHVRKRTWAHARRVEVFVDGGSARVVTPYNLEWINAFKVVMPNRSYDASSREWIIPTSDLGLLIALMEHAGVDVQPELRMCASQACESHGPLATGCGVQNSAICTWQACEGMPLDLEFQLEGTVFSLSVRYNATIVNVIKQLHPHQRQFDHERKKWALEPEGGPEPWASMACRMTYGL